MLLGAAVDGLPRLVHVPSLALVGLGLSPVVRRKLPQLLLALAQLALRPLQVLAAEEVLDLFGELGGFRLRCYVRLFGFACTLGSGPVVAVILRRLS
jgi:hypothetical protein